MTTVAERVGETDDYEELLAALETRTHEEILDDKAEYLRMLEDVEMLRDLRVEFGVEYQAKCFERIDRDIQWLHDKDPQYMLRHWGFTTNEYHGANE